MVNLTIDGRKLQAEAGRTVLQAARDNKIVIPTLCYHESLPAYGACRLCMVSIERHGRERLVVSCLYPVEEGLDVKTSTPRVDSVRRMVLDLLLARCPDSDVIKDLAAHTAWKRAASGRSRGTISASYARCARGFARIPWGPQPSALSTVASSARWRHPSRRSQSPASRAARALLCVPPGPSP